MSDSREGRPGLDPHSPAVVTVFVVVLLGSLAALLYLLSSFFTDAVLGFMFAALSRPMYTRLVDRGLRPWAAAGLVTALVTLLIAVPATYLVTSLSQQAARAYALSSSFLSSEALSGALFGEGVVPTLLRDIFELLGLSYSPEGVRRAVRDVAGAVAAAFSSEVNALVSNVFSGLYHFVMLQVILYYGLLDGPELLRRLFEASPLPDDEERLIVGKFRDVGSAILFGNGIGSAAQGLLGGLSMWACGLSSPLFWGSVMTLFAFLPLVGITIVVIPVALYLMLLGKWIAAVVFLGFNFVQATLIENVVKTKLIGDRMHMHSGLVFFALLGGLSMYGIIGILYGPLIVTFFVTVYDLYHRIYKAELRIP